MFEVDLPGLKPEEFRMSVEGDVLCISGKRSGASQCERHLRVERPAGEFVRRLALPPDARSDEVQATFREGVLELRLPKSRPNA